jgi:hypothetical protein
MICDMTKPAERSDSCEPALRAIAKSARVVIKAPERRVVTGFVVPNGGALFEDELLREANLALDRIWACLKEHLGLAEAAEAFARFQMPRQPGRRTSLSASQKRWLEGLSKVYPRQKIAHELAGGPGFPDREAIEKMIQRHRGKDANLPPNGGAPKKSKRNQLKIQR